MHSTLLTTLAFTATALAAPLTVGKAVVNNHCGAPVFVTGVDSGSRGPFTLASGASWSEVFKFDPTTGEAIKITTKEDGVGTGAPTLHFSYSLNNKEGSIYYDISTVYGYDPLFQGKNLVLHGTSGKDPKVPEIAWNGAPAPSQTKAYFGDTDLIFELCAM